MTKGHPRCRGCPYRRRHSQCAETAPKRSFRTSATRLPPRPFTRVNDTVAIAIILCPGRRAPIFFVTQPAVTVGVERAVARLPGCAIIGVIKAAAVPTIRIFGLGDPTIPVCVAGRSIVVPFCSRDSTISIGVDPSRAAGGLSAFRVECRCH